MQTETSNAGVAEEAIPAAPESKARGFRVGRYRVRYLRSEHPLGWGHDEGDSTSRTLFGASLLYEADRCTAARLIVGRQSLWLFF